MRISSMRTGLKADLHRMRLYQGFTLIELLVVLLIISAMTGLGAGLFSLDRNPLHEGARLVETAVSMARNSAMLRNRPVYLELQEEGLEVRETEEASPKGDRSKQDVVSLRQGFPFGVKVVTVNEEAMNGNMGAAVLCFRSQGVTSERVICLSDGMRTISIYIPAVGKPLTLEGRFSLEQMRKEYL